MTVAEWSNAAGCVPVIRGFESRQSPLCTARKGLLGKGRWLSRVKVRPPDEALSGVTGSISTVEKRSGNNLTRHFDY